MTKSLSFAKHRSLPIEAVTQKFAFLGQSGSGKTYGAGKFVEGLLKAGAQVVILDRVGIWYGLRSGASKDVTGFPIPVLGGAHGDLPLVPTSGSLIADVLVQQGCSMVLDVSEFRKGERKQFVTDLVEQLFHRKKQARSPIHLVIEEAQAYCPQMAFKGEERMLGAFEDICKLGRNYGIGYTLISQRPQALHKEVLNQTGTLVVFRMTGPQERKVMEGWINEQGGIHKEMVQDLPSLPTGTAYLWSPEWLGCYEKIQILSKQTLDASKTPTLHSKVVSGQPQRIDLSQLETAMAETVKATAEKDPATLQKRIRELEGQVLHLEKANWTLQANPVLQVTIPSDIATQVASLAEKAEALWQAVQRVHQDAVAANQVKQSSAPSPKLPAPRPSVSSPSSKVAGAGPTRILTVLAQHPGGKPLNTVATLAGYTVNGHFRNMLGALRSAGHITGGHGGHLEITPAGLDVLGPYEPLPTGAELRAYWLGKATSGEGRILQVLFEAYPAAVPTAELAQKSGYTVNGHFRNMMGHLRTMQLIEGHGAVTAAESLFA